MSATEYVLRRGADYLRPDGLGGHGMPYLTRDPEQAWRFAYATTAALLQATYPGALDGFEVVPVAGRDRCRDERS